MKLVYENMEHILRFGEGYINELIVENKKMFFKMVNSVCMQADGLQGEFVMSISDKVVEFGKNAEVIIQFAPFQMNRKSLLTKLHASLEQRATDADFYLETLEILKGLESFVSRLAGDLPFEIDCKKISIGPVIRALSPEVDEEDKNTLEKIFSYMEIVRELDRERLFVMINMRTYFSYEEMQEFVKSANLHGFKVLLLENIAFPLIENTKRYVIDDDLCEF